MLDFAFEDDARNWFRFRLGATLETEDFVESVERYIGIARLYRSWQESAEERNRSADQITQVVKACTAMKKARKRRGDKAWDHVVREMMKTGGIAPIGVLSLMMNKPMPRGHEVIHSQLLSTLKDSIATEDFLDYLEQTAEGALRELKNPSNKPPDSSIQNLIIEVDDKFATCFPRMARTDSPGTVFVEVVSYILGQAFPNEEMNARARIRSAF